MTPDDKLVYIDAVRHVGEQEAPLTVGIRGTRLAGVGHQRFIARGMSLHLTSIGDSVDPLWETELRASDGTVLKSAPAAHPFHLALIWEWMTDLSGFAPAQLPGSLGFWGVQHTETGQWLARWDGAPQRWSTQGDADADTDLIAFHLRPRRSLDVSTDSDWWRQ